MARERSVSDVCEMRKNERNKTSQSDEEKVGHH